MLPPEPLECMRVCEKAILDAPKESIIIGASLGGFYAHYLSLKYTLDALLLNPVTQASLEAELLSQKENTPRKKARYTHACGVYKTFEKDISSFSQVKNSFLALGKNDTIIHPSIAQQVIKNATITIYDDDHYLLNSFEKILSDYNTHLNSFVTT